MTCQPTHRPSRRAAALAAVLLTAVGLAPAAADAATVRISGSSLLYAAESEPLPSLEFNAVTVSASIASCGNFCFEPVYIIDDSGATISSPDGSCVIGQNGHRATCEASAVGLVDIDLRSLNDSATIQQVHAGDVTDIDGGQGNDVLNGGPGRDVLRDGANSQSDGVDTLNGGAGDDELNGNGPDPLDGGAGADDLKGGGTAIYSGRSDPVTVTVGSGQDDGNSEDQSGNRRDDVQVPNVTGGSGNDLLTATGGVLDGGPGADDLMGTGTASYSGRTGTVTVTVGSGQDDGNSSDQSGNRRDSVIVDNATGGSGNDTLTGDADDNILDGGSGADDVVGGGGSDTASYQSHSSSPGGVTVTLNAGTANDGNASDESGGRRDDAVTENATGGSGSDTLTGDASDNALRGGAGGADALNGGPGNDRLFGGNGIGDEACDPFFVDLSAYGCDVLDGGTGADDIRNGIATYAGRTEAVTVVLPLAVGGPQGGPADESGGRRDVFANVTEARGGEGDDDMSVSSAFAAYNKPAILRGGGGNDSLTGHPGIDYFEGGSGQDTLDGAAGPDYLAGGPDTDTASYANRGAGVEVTLNDDSQPDGNAEDTGTNPYGLFRDDAQTENVTGGRGDNVLRGDDGPNALTGGSANDSLLGGPGNDTLSAGDGRDDARGGEGDDSIDGGGDPFDDLSGEAGDDSLFSRDGRADDDVCGEGTDVVTADAAELDTVADDCEQVARPVPGGGGGAGDAGDTGGGGAGAGGAGGVEPNAVGVAAKAKVSRTGVVSLAMTCRGGAGSRCAGTASMETSGPIAARARRRKLKLGRRSFSIPAGTRSIVRIKLSQPGRRALRRLRRLRVRVTVTLRPEAGAAVPARSTRTLTLRAPRRS